nr:hypothetical protein [Tanacetum cinerariifolium]
MKEKLDSYKQQLSISYEFRTDLLRWCVSLFVFGPLSSVGAATGDIENGQIAYYIGRIGRIVTIEGRDGSNEPTVMSLRQ